MVRLRTRIVVVFATAALALTACTSAATKTEPTSKQNPTSTNTQKPITQETAPAPSPSPSQGPSSKGALGDVKLGVVRVDSKLGTPSAEITITNHSSKRSNYIVDLSITSADGKIKLDAAMVSAQGLAPGQIIKKTGHFKTTQKLPAGARLTVVGVARLVA